MKHRRVRAADGYEPFWKVKSVAEVLVDGDTEFHCKDCHGEVKLNKRLVVNGLPRTLHTRSETHFACATLAMV